MWTAPAQFHFTLIIIRRSSPTRPHDLGDSRVLLQHLLTIPTNKFHRENTRKTRNLIGNDREGSTFLKLKCNENSARDEIGDVKMGNRMEMIGLELPNR